MSRHTQTSFSLSYPPRAHSQGFTLVIGLVFLLLIAILGLSAMQASILDEKMASNDRERNLAFQAAEDALRDAERDIKGLNSAGAACTSCRPANRGLPSALNGFRTRLTEINNTCIDGICYFPVDFANLQKWAASSTAAENTLPHTFWRQAAYQGMAADYKRYLKATRYGTYTGAAPLANLASTPDDLRTDQQPIYWIEVIDKTGVGQSRFPFYYRITALAAGSRSTKAADGTRTGTYVVLQTTIDPDL